MTESQLQQKIIMWYRNEYQMNGKGLIFSVANESTYKNKNFKATGTMAGVSDLVVVTKNKVLFIELKTETGEQSPAQIKFQNAIENLNQNYFLVRSLEQFKEIMKCYH